MRKEIILATAYLVASCQAREQPITPSPTYFPTYLPATLVPTETAEAISLEEKAAAAVSQAKENFLDSLFISLNHSSPYIAHSGLEFYNSAQRNDIKIFSSIPTFNEFGELIRRPESNQVACYFDEQGNFLTLFNTNIYYYNDVSVEATVAWLDECLNFRAAVLGRYDSFRQTNPEVSLPAALEQNPQWIDESIVEAWYPTTARIIVPYREKMPLRFTTILVGLHDRCGIDFTQHEIDPEKKERDWTCWKENFGKIPFEQLEL